MKIMFILMSCLLAVALSVLAAIVGTGKIPFQPPRPEGESAANGLTNTPVAVTTDAAPKISGSIFAGQEKMVDDLVKALKEGIEKNEAKAKALEAERAELNVKIAKMTELETRLAKLNTEVSQKIVQIGENEEINFKKLADMYSKMEPDSAATLLQNTEADRAAKIISLIGERQAAAIMNAAVAKGGDGKEKAGEWSDALRRMTAKVKTEATL